jgi:beta-lactamase class A
MAHAAKINAGGIVEEVVVVPDGLGGDENDEAINAYCNQLGLEGTWIRTSYNAAENGFRGAYAGAGFRYDPSADTFVPPAG